MPEDVLSGKSDCLVIPKNRKFQEKPAENRHEAKENTKPMTVAGGENLIKEQSYP